MNKKIITIGIIAAILIIVTIFALNNRSDSMMEKTGSIIIKDNDSMTMENSEYVGNILAGKTSPYLEFNNEDYQKALAENKVILLNFYANWCPICKEEEPNVFDAFNDLNNTEVIGFRVNYKDDDTDEFEIGLARQFGINYQHTKVIIVEGKQVLKAPDSWDKAKYLSQINKFLS